MKKYFFILLTILSVQLAHSQSLEKMQWFNEPTSWSIDNGKLEMQVAAQTDYWRNTNYGFTADDGAFYYTTKGGEFEVNVKAIGDYEARYDHMGLMLRIDEKRWIKTGIEYVGGVYNFSTVVTDTYSNWSVIQLDEKPEAVWIRAIRKLDAVEIFYSFDGENYKLSNIVHFADNCPVMVGMMAASPDGAGFKAFFEDFEVKHIPDTRRVQWLEKNK